MARDKRKHRKRRKKENGSAEVPEQGLTPDEAGKQVYPPRGGEPPPPPAVPVPGQRQPRGASGKPPGRVAEEPELTVPPVAPTGVPERRGQGPEEPRRPEGQPDGGVTGAGRPDGGETGAVPTGKQSTAGGTSDEAGGVAPPGGLPGSGERAPYYGPAYYWPPPMWYPPPYPYPGYYGVGYPPVPMQEGAPPETAQHFPGPMEQTGPMPVIPMMSAPPGVPPEAPMPPEGMHFPPPMVPPMPTVFDVPEEAPGFGELAAGGGRVQWRSNLRWVLGIVIALLIMTTLTLAGLYRVSSSGNSNNILVPLIDVTTEVREIVEDEYLDLSKKARRNKSASYQIPDIGVEVSIEGETILDLDSDKLADQVISEIAGDMYSNGYGGELPMKYAQGVGEERGKATAMTFMATLNKNTHKAVFWPIFIFGGLAIALMVGFLFLCHGWGRVYGAGLVIIASALPGALLLRILGEFAWRVEGAGLYRGAAHQALRSSAGLIVLYFDLALGGGALILLAGVIGAVISRRRRDREPPFMELEEPMSAVAGGPPVQPGLAPVPRKEENEEAVKEAAAPPKTPPPPPVAPGRGDTGD